MYGRKQGVYYVWARGPEVVTGRYILPPCPTTRVNRTTPLLPITLQMKRSRAGVAKKTATATSEGREPGTHETRVISFDFGRKNFSYWIGDVSVQCLTKKAVAKEALLPADAAEDTIPLVVGNLKVITKTLAWRRINFMAYDDGSAIVDTDGATGASQGMRIKAMLLFLIGHNHLQSMFDLCDKYEPVITLFEQQLGPSKFTASCNPGMFVLMYAIYALMVNHHPRWRKHPPELVGPSASKSTCNAIQSSFAFLNSGAESRIIKKRVKKLLKKQQVVHVMDWLMRRYTPSTASAYWASGAKRDDMADCFLQVISFLLRHQTRLKRELRKGVAEPCVMTTGIPEIKGMFDDHGAPTHTAHVPHTQPTPPVETPLCIRAGVTYARFPRGEYVVYLLLATEGRGLSYVGCTNDMPHRYRQHCGELVGGARATKMAAGWVPGVIVTGFTHKCQALSFESQWKRAKSDGSKWKPNKSHRTISTRMRKLSSLLSAPQWLPHHKRLRCHYMWDTTPTLPGVLGTIATVYAPPVAVGP